MGKEGEIRALCGPGEADEFAAAELGRDDLRLDAGPAAGDGVQVGLSRSGITREQGASLARDTSHSRPHRVADASTYDVNEGFERSALQLAKRIEEQWHRNATDQAQAIVQMGDARQIRLLDHSVDAIMTSPPYLNAIDYMRGHRMSLVWLGHRIADLRSIRSNTIGAERSGEGDNAIN